MVFTLNSAATPQRRNAATPQRRNAATPQRRNAATPQRRNAATPQQQASRLNPPHFVRSQPILKRIPNEIITGWLTGRLHPGVCFVYHEDVVVVAGPHRGKLVNLVMLAVLEPEPQYLAANQDGHCFIVKQSELRKRTEPV